METRTIEEVLAYNEAMVEKLAAVAEQIAESAESSKADAWSIGQVIEHVAMVDEGLTRICEKLISRARAEERLGDGSLHLSDSFTAKAAGAVTEKLAAPAIVEPTGSMAPHEAIAKMRANNERFAALRRDLEAFDGTHHKFPHPYFGDLSAHEWLALRGGHAARHLRQIKAMEKK